jgi:hypothetical protein
VFSSLYILDINPHLLNTGKDFLPSMGCLFILVIVYFDVLKFFLTLWNLISEFLLLFPGEL